MFKTKFIVSFLALLCVSVFKVNAQGITLEQESDTTINVVAYFCKNDTMSFRNHQLKQKIIENDTTVTYDMTQEFMIVVNDSTSKGYRMEFIPISCKWDTLEDFNSLTEDLWDMVKDVHCFFTTDEYGTVQHIENWREIRDTMKKITPIVVDRYIEKHPEMDKVISRKQIKNALLMGFSTENQIRKAYDELDMLFSLHGRCLDMGTKELDDVENGYPQHIVAKAGYTEIEDESDIEGDYAIMTKTVTTIPMEDAVNLGINSAMLFLEGNVADSLDSKKDEILDSLKSGIADKEITFTQNEYFGYFFNGWPKLCYKEKVIDGTAFKRVEQNVIEWTSRYWNIYNNDEAIKPEDSKEL